MSHIDRLRRSPKNFRQLTGVTPNAFDRLLDQLAPLYDAADARRKARPGRLRRPRREPRGGELTARLEEEDVRLARRRVVAEHGIGKMKVWRIASERYRNATRRHTLVMKDVAGLHNLMDA